MNGGSSNPMPSCGPWQRDTPSDFPRRAVFDAVLLKGLNLHWFEFDQAITINNEIEEINYNTNYSLDFNIDFGVPMIDWIQKSNFYILSSNPVIKVYDFDDNI